MIIIASPSISEGATFLVSVTPAKLVLDLIGEHESGLSLIFFWDKRSV
jgi:hypothetical protein